MKTIELPNAQTRDAAIAWLMDQGHPTIEQYIDEWKGDGWRIHETFANYAGRATATGVKRLVIERRIFAEIQDDELAFEFALRFGS
jgi:hypothetical protein